MPDGPKRKELCPTCGKQVAVRKDGTLWRHNGLEYDGMWGTICSNAGRAVQR